MTKTKTLKVINNIHIFFFPYLFPFPFWKTGPLPSLSEKIYITWEKTCVIKLFSSAFISFSFEIKCFFRDAFDARPWQKDWRFSKGLLFTKGGISLFFSSFSTVLLARGGHGSRRPGGRTRDGVNTARNVLGLPPRAGLHWLLQPRPGVGREEVRGGGSLASKSKYWILHILVYATY